MLDVPPLNTATRGCLVTRVALADWISLSAMVGGAMVMDQAVHS